MSSLGNAGWIKSCIRPGIVRKELNNPLYDYNWAYRYYSKGAPKGDFQFG